jgi:hypothetical protein
MYNCILNSLEKKEISCFVFLREIRFSAISLIYKINKRGTSTDPWGTPAETLQSEEDELFIRLERAGWMVKEMADVF